MVYFKINYAYYEVTVKVHYFARGYPIVPTPFIKRLSFLHGLLCILGVGIFPGSIFCCIDLFVHLDTNSTLSCLL